MIHRRIFVLALIGALAGCSSSSAGPFIGAGPAISVALSGGMSSLALSSSTPTGTITASETGYNGTFAAVSSNPSVATVSPSSASAIFTVTAVAGGTTTITITDATGNKATVSVGVTTLSGVISVAH